MAPKKQKLSPDAKQPGIAAAFSKPARSSGEGGGLCEPLSLFVRTCASPEFDDYSVNHIFSESGAKVSSDESERAEDGAGNGVSGFCLRCAAHCHVRRAPVRGGVARDAAGTAAPRGPAVRALALRLCNSRP